VVRPQLLMSAAELMITATTVMVTMLIRIAPLTLRAISPMVSSTPRQKTSTGQPVSEPVAPNCTGTVVFATSGMRLTKPASTKPMKAMKSPMPTPMACFSGCGMAFMTASRSPVRTSTQMITPSMTHQP
jgi:hypothetical protein